MVKHNWTERMDKIIRKHYGKKSYEQMVKLLGVPVTAAAVRVRYSYLLVKQPNYAFKLKFYTPADERYIIRNYNKMTVAELAAHFGVKQSAMDKKICKMRDKIPNGHIVLKPHAKAAPIGTIKTYKEKSGNYYQSEKTADGWVRIKTRVKCEKKEKVYKAPKYGEAERLYCMEHLPLIGAKEVAKALNVTPRAIHQQVGVWRQKGFKIEIRRISKGRKPRKAKSRKQITSVVSRIRKPEPRKKALKLIPDLAGKISVRVNSKTVLMVRPGTDIEALKLKYA